METVFLCLILFGLWSAGTSLPGMNEVTTPSTKNNDLELLKRAVNPSIDTSANKYFKHVFGYLCDGYVKQIEAIAKQNSRLTYELEELRRQKVEQAWKDEKTKSKEPSRSTRRSFNNYNTLLPWGGAMS